MEVVDRLGRLRRSAGYGGRRAFDLRDARGIVPPVASLVALERHDDARLALLLALFTDCAALTREQAAGALAPLTIEQLAQAGLVDVDGERVLASIRVSDFDGLILAGDPAAAETQPSYVMPVTLASKWLARMTVRRDVATALDLGTGSGVQALLAARHAAEVVGVDVSAHALSLARLSERLNGEPGRISWLEGSWLEPLEGARFDLVAANPPFVISPDNDFVYRDSADPGDELSRTVVRACGAALNDGGVASVMCNWIHAEEAWEQPLREWIGDLGCDALLLRAYSEDPLEYAMHWNSSRHERDPEGFAATVDGWFAHYLRIGVPRIAMGFVILRRRSSGPNWVQTFDGVHRARGKGGPQLERMLAAGDFFAAHPGARGLGELLSRPWRVLDRHRLDQSAVYADGAYVGEGTMRMDPDAGISATIDPRVLGLLQACDGERTLGELIGDAEVPDGVDRGAFQSLCIGAFRDLVARGCLVSE
jgi:methylase of polypeptide subunit release factors